MRMRGDTFALLIVLVLLAAAAVWAGAPTGRRQPRAGPLGGWPPPRPGKAESFSWGQWQENTAREN